MYLYFKGSLSQDEISKIVDDFKHNENNHLDKEVVDILKKYDDDNDGELEVKEVEALVQNNKLSDSSARYAAYARGYSLAFQRAFRYLAFTSDVGEALRPVVDARIVTGTYIVAGGYCVAGDYFDCTNICYA